MSKEKCLRSRDQLPIDAAVRAPDFWRYDGQPMTLFRLEEETYRAHEETGALPGLTRLLLSQYIVENKTLTARELIVLHNARLALHPRNRLSQLHNPHHPRRETPRVRRHRSASLTARAESG